MEAFLPLAELVDSDKERARLNKQLGSLQAGIDKLAARLASPGFADKAPPAVVTKAETELAEQREQLAGVERALAQLPS